MMLLFLGNSYTFQNELDVAVEGVFAAAGDTVEAERLANPGWRFVDHLGEVETAGSAHATAFATPRDWMILQEQSQIPGFPEGQADLEASREAAVALDGHAAGAGAETMFLMTWGRRDGDRDNPSMYPDYPTMQGLLTEGYLAYVSLASEDGTRAWVAPAGLAWQRVYDDVVAAGEDPLAEGSAFHGLYVDDGSHPSQRGTYLAACVIYASLTGESPEGLDAPAYVPDAAYLQAVAAAVVLEGEGIVYPWMDDTPDDTGDTGGDTAGEPDTDSGPADTGGADTAEDIAATDEAGCGCGTGSVGWIGWVGVLAVAGRRRR